ncbi:MAG: L-serine ammonia-lyase [Planctomycetota bacterium]|jgi:L-serine dehydratase
MSLSVFDMYSIGIGPSSSHTVGPMRAARRFIHGLRRDGRLADVAKLKVELFGSLGHTGVGHGSDRAVILGLLGETPESVDPDSVGDLVDAVVAAKAITPPDGPAIPFDPVKQIVFHKRQSLPGHPNGMRFRADDAQGTEIRVRVYYSVGGGFVVAGDTPAEAPVIDREAEFPIPFATGEELLRQCDEHGLSVSGVMRRNERVFRPDAEIDARLDQLWEVMRACVERGCRSEGILPGGLKVKRRAADTYRRLKADSRAQDDALRVMDWVNLWALAVNEENAAGGRVVTAPTNGAAGILPAVLHYYMHHVKGADQDGVRRMLLCAAAIGMLYKLNASISGAEVGCQGEVGVACSMAAGALTEALGGTPAQVENAAEIGMEHNLGLTCDPVGGLVQVPCIERNAMGAVKAINAARLALQGDGRHHISLDKVIATMHRTGADMHRKYKEETSRGGLAVNVIEC